jgi:Protein of unknown function (DUF1761)
MSEINMLAVLVAAFASFVFGALWYSPLLFLKRWCQEAGVDPSAQVDSPAKVYGLTFVLTLIATVVFAIVVGAKPDVLNSVLSGALVGACLVATSLGINYQFSKASIMHWLIDSGFHIGRFSLMGLILGIWH